MFLQGLGFRSPAVEENMINEEELKIAIQTLKPGKSPRPDNFHPGFFTHLHNLCCSLYCVLYCAVLYTVLYMINKTVLYISLPEKSTQNLEILEVIAIRKRNKPAIDRETIDQ